jgi:hypothetical protein
VPAAEAVAVVLMGRGIWIFRQLATELTVDTGPDRTGARHRRHPSKTRHHHRQLADPVL